MSDGENNRSLAGWWGRVRRSFPGRGGHAVFAGHPAEEAVVFASKILRPFLDGMGAVPAPVLVDLGPVIGANISYLGKRLSCKIHPEDLYADVDRLVRDGNEERVPEVLAARLTQEPRTVDGILAWDFFDYLRLEEAKGLARQLVRMLKPGGLMLALFATVPREDRSARKYLIVDDGHLSERRAPAARKARSIWLGGDIEGLLAPLEVVASHLSARRRRETLLRQPIVRRKEG